MTEIEQATQALIAAIDAGFRRRDDERQLLAQCENAKKLIHQQCRRIERRRDYKRSRPAVEEQKLEATLKQDVIDAGYRSLAAKLHPDKGGSHETMSRLNQVRDKLRRGII